MTLTIPDLQPIIGSPSIGLDNLLRLAPRNAANSRIAAACVSVGQLANIGDVFLFAWAAKETGNYMSERWVQSFNPAGLGATNDGAYGGIFPNEAAGFTAMAGHAIGYAVPASAMTFTQSRLAAFDPRRDALKAAHGFGCAPRFVDLWQKWGVITKGPVPEKMASNAYGMSIIVRVRGLLASIGL